MFKKIATTFGVKLAIALLNLAIVVVLSRYLGAAGKGEASLVITSIAMILLFTNMVGGSTLVYFVPRYPVVQLFLWSNAWSILVCGVAYFFIQLLSGIPPAIILPIVVLSLINSFMATNLTILLGYEKINTYNLVSLLQVVVNILVLLFFLWGVHEENIFAYIYSLYAAMGVCLLMSLVFILPYVGRNKEISTKGLLAKLFKNGVTSQAGHVMKFVSFRFTYYLLVAFTGEVALGIFSNAVSIIESTFLICNSIATILYPKVANSSDLKSSQQLTLLLTKACIVLCVLALLVLVLLPGSFFVWLFGNEFAQVNQVILLLAPGILFYNIALVIGHYFSGVGKFRVNSYANLVGLLTTLILAGFWYPHYNMVSISIISTIAYITTSLFIIIYFIKDAQIKAWALLPTFTDYKWLRGNLKKVLFNK